jgi:hypothetical protein
MRKTEGANLALALGRSNVPAQANALPLRDLDRAPRNQRRHTASASIQIWLTAFEDQSVQFAPRSPDRLYTGTLAA